MVMTSHKRCAHFGEPLFSRHVLLLVLALSLLVTAGASAFNADWTAPDQDVVEIVYVKGCSGDSSPLRSTAGCFASGHHEEQITLRGMHFPHEQDGSTPELGVVFEESMLPSIFEDEPGYAKGAASKEAVKAVRIACTTVTPSSLFPSQLLTCQLPRPSVASLDADDDATREAFLARAQAYPVWFDAKLLWRGHLISVLRRALEVDMRHQPKRATAAVQYHDDGSVLFSAASEEPADGDAAATAEDSRGASLESLERLYVPGVGSDATVKDVWRSELGVGGLKDELQTLYRRVFVSRLPSLSRITDALGLQHVRGVILYGPPGNGKTLVARGLVKLLGPDTRMTIVNAGDVLSKYVGESEKNLRDLFEGREMGSTARQEDAESEHRSPQRDEPALGGLHVLVIDEFDALFRRRGHSEDESSAKAVFDGVTNALLSLMDGVRVRNDILVIGLTNRLDAVDDALLRPGRFEVLIEVPAPDSAAREEILFIHTEKLRQQHFLDDDVNLAQLAADTSGLSGSDIAGIVRAATSHALLQHRHALGHAQAGADGSDPAVATFRVTASEFTRAVKEVRDGKRGSGLESASGSANDVLNLVDHDGTLVGEVAAIVNLTNRIRLGAESPSRLPWLRAVPGAADGAFAALVTLSGPTGSGKTVVSRFLTQQVPDAAGVELLSGRQLAEMADDETMLATVQQTLSAAAKSAGMHIVVLDDYDVLHNRLSGKERSAKRLQSLIRKFLRSREVSLATLSTGAAKRHADLHLTSDEPLRDGQGQALNSRLLLLTSARPSAWRDFDVDMKLYTKSVSRRGVRRALAHMGLVEDANSTITMAVSQMYPSSLQYADFLRLTQMALAADVVSADVDRANAAREENSAAGVLITDEEIATRFMMAVETAAHSMALYDPFSSWFSSTSGGNLRPAEVLERVKKMKDADVDAAATDLFW